MSFKRIAFKVGLTGLYYLNSETLYKFFRVFIPRLSSIFLHITNECSYNCSYCYVEKSKPALRYEAWLRIIEDAADAGVKKVSFLGGEPFQAEYLEDLLKRAKQLNLKSYIYTNGSLIDDRWIKRLKIYNPVVIFKYDLNDAIYQAHTRQMRFTLKEIEGKIVLCGRAGLKIMTFTTLCSDNIAGVQDILESSLRCGAFPFFERYLPVKCPEINKSLEVSDEAFSGAMEKINKRLSYLRKEWIAALRILGGGCGFFRDVIAVSPAGEILPCPYLPDNLSMGNIKDKTIKEIIDILKSKESSKYALSGECLDCRHKHICNGGCKAYPLLKYGKYMPNCSYEAFLSQCAYMFMDLYGYPDIL